MVTFEKSVTIDAPPEKVFGFIEDPKHLVEIMPGMVEVKDIEKLPTGGYRYHWVYKMAGFPFEGETETTKFVPHELIVDRTKGQIESTFDWKFFAENGGTHVTLAVGYEVPKAVFEKFAEKFVLKLNEREAETTLLNLKDRIEF
jgi:uncharacterized protein YndB with AHSA1/START domain